MRMLGLRPRVDGMPFSPAGNSLPQTLVRLAAVEFWLSLLTISAICSSMNPRRSSMTKMLRTCLQNSSTSCGSIG